MMCLCVRVVRLTRGDYGAAIGIGSRTYFIFFQSYLLHVNIKGGMLDCGSTVRCGLFGRVFCVG